jgi:hypothetical protein
MATRVKLQDIIEALDRPNRDWKSYVNRGTGAIVTVMEDMAMGPDGELDPAVIGESDDFLPLPTSEEIDEWSMMEKFALQRSEPLSGELLDGLSGRGAFRMFRTIVKRAGIEDEWDRFREQAFASMAREWLDEHSIPYE